MELKAELKIEMLVKNVREVGGKEKWNMQSRDWWKIHEGKVQGKGIKIENINTSGKY